MDFIGVGLVMIMLVSSANNVGLDLLDLVFGKLLTYKGKNNGQSTEPCGITHFTSSH